MQPIVSIQKKEHRKSPELSVSSPQEKPLDGSGEEVVESGMPLFLRRFSSSTPSPIPSPPGPDRTDEKENLVETPVLPKLMVGAPDDEYEQEADRVADTVMHLPVKDNSRIVEKEDGHDERKLPEHVRLKIEPVLGTDLGHVKVRSDIQANQAAESIHAKAFTHRNTIYLGKGESAGDLPLMAHEAAHVAQQQRSSSIPGIQRFLIPEELMSCMDHSALSSRQLRRRLELVESTLCQADYSSSDYAMLELERTNILNELSRPERGGPESSQAEGTRETTANQWTRPPTGILSARNMRIIASPENHPEVIGRTVRYWYDYPRPMTIRSADSPSEASYIRQVIQNWKVTDPDGNERDMGSEREIEVQLNRPGRWEIGIILEVSDGTHHLWYQHDIIRPSDIARNRMAQTSTEDFLHFRARLEQERLRLERFSEWGAVNSRRERPYITCGQPNPAGATNDPDRIYHRYTMNPSSTGRRFRWYVRASDWEHTSARIGYRRATFGEAGFSDYPNTPSDIEFERQSIDGENAWVSSRYLNTSYSVFTFIMTQPGLYTIVCEELTAEGTPSGQMARYIQVVADPQEMRQIEAIRRHIRLTDENIEKIEEGREAPVRAVYVNNETGQAMTLSMYIGPDKDDEDTIKLLDLTPGVGRMEYDGDSVSDALDTFNSGNVYPVGIIHLEIPANEAGIQPQSRSFETTGSSDWSDWAGGTGWAALTLGVLGVIAIFAPIPGSRVIAGICFIGAAAVGGVSAGISLYERLHQAEIDETGVAVDVLGIASSIIGGASAFRALRYGATVAIGTRAGRYLLWAGFSTDLVSGTLLTIQGVNEINRIIESDAPRGEKIGAIVRILSMLALNGGLLIVSVRDLRTARGRIGGHIGEDISQGLSADIIHSLNLFDDDALRAIRGASSQELQRISNLIRINRDAANKLTRAVGRNVLDHTIESLEGRIRINNQLDIHPSRLVQIADNDLATILRATAETPVNTAALLPFTRSGSYRLRFHFQLAENETWLRRVINDANLSGHPEASRLLANLDDVGRMRLQEARTGSIPKGVRDQIENRATRYALEQRPANALEFVNHYEMFVSEYNRRRVILQDRIQERMDALIQGAPPMPRDQAHRQASREILGVEIDGFGAAFNNAVLNGPPNMTSGSPYRGLTDLDVGQRYTELATYLGGQAGARRVGIFIDPNTLGSRIQGMSNLQFGSESAAVYHVNKHTGELPHAHLEPSYGGNPMARYLRSANETIQGGVAQVARNQDGSFNVTVTQNYGNQTMRAILRVGEDGRVVIATYGRM